MERIYDHGDTVIVEVGRMQDAIEVLRELFAELRAKNERLRKAAEKWSEL